MIYFRLVDKRDLFTQCYLHIGYQIHSSILGYYMASDNAIKSPLALKCHQYQPFHNEHIWGRAHIALAQRGKGGQGRGLLTNVNSGWGVLKSC